jgi:hypothetical protein
VGNGDRSARSIRTFTKGRFAPGLHAYVVLCDRILRTLAISGGAVSTNDSSLATCYLECDRPGRVLLAAMLLLAWRTGRRRRRRAASLLEIEDRLRQFGHRARRRHIGRLRGRRRTLGTRLRHF